MNQAKKITLLFTALTVLLIFSSFSAGAAIEKEIAVDKFYSYDEKLLCISHRGDTAFYPENSFEGLKSALEKGADFVSVNLEKTADGVFYLCEDESLGNVCNTSYDCLSEMKSDEVSKFFLYDIYGNKTEYKMTSLEKLLDETDGEDGIILDVKPEYKEDVYNIIRQKGALGRIILRVDESGRRLAEWAESKDEKVYVIGKYTGNIIFSTISQIKELTEAEMPAVQYESKNYFNVAFGEFFTNRYHTASNVRAIAATWSPELCGQREDSADGWNELIRKGYSVIETNNIEAFNAYRQECKRLEKEISKLVEKAFYVDSGLYSEVSLSNLRDAELNGRYNIMGDAAFSLGEAQECYSQLIFAFKELKISAGEVDTRGALNVTAGKVIAAVLVGAGLLAGQIYVYSMRKSKKVKKG